MDGIPIRIHMYFDPQKAVLDEKALYDDIQRKEQALQELIKQKAIKATTKKYFTVTESGDKTIEYQLDYDKVDALKDRLGYFALV
ncbi:hypothetical protein [Fundicoccus culcitae]|uniref:Uncharacterized protein n=1 Tax=Fundicoccus culcitae TaxID=2969821 RepID=A0ABY5PA12_9LACT|nr:hypothetical protein [Fundicoccus culcitae]UUX35220.1 hypothetical protein NRE15_06140 [Fundicoccus culcitae]